MKCDLSDFKYYSKDGRRWLAVYITKENLPEIAKCSGLIEPLDANNDAFCFGVMCISNVNRWLIVKLDQRNDRPISLETDATCIFERDYRYMSRENGVNNGNDGSCTRRHVYIQD